MNLFNVVSVEEAKKIMGEEFPHMRDNEEIDIKNSLGRIIGEDIVSQINIPDFKRSVVDGYAVRAKDVVGASESIPAIMELKGEVEMGKASEVSLEHVGECVYVPTGGMIPEGADSMVMIEYTEKLEDGTVFIYNPVPWGDKIVDIGEDVQRGERVLKKGSLIRPYEIGLLSSLGLQSIKVRKKPVIGIISTGDEIISTGETPRKGQVRDMNSSILESSIRADNFDYMVLGVAKDTFSSLKKIMDRGIEKCDVILVSGGSSVGKKDQTLKVIESYEGAEVLAHGISIKPGKPTIIAKVHGKPVFGLPGHPLSCSVVYKAIVSDMLKKSMGYYENKYPITCSSGVNYHKAKGREEYIPVLIEEREELIAHPVLTKSGLITGFTKSWGYIIVDKNEEGIAKGQKVKAYKF